MSKVIIYIGDDGEVCTIHPNEEYVAKFSIEELAEKDVPHNKKYKIVDVSEIPSDQQFRNAWQIAESELTDGVGASHNYFVDDVRHPKHPDYVAP